MNNIPHQSQANGQTKRMNSTIRVMLKTLSEKQKHSWKDPINRFSHAYSCNSYSITG